MWQASQAPPPPERHCRMLVFLCDFPAGTGLLEWVGPQSGIPFGIVSCLDITCEGERSQFHTQIPQKRPHIPLETPTVSEYKVTCLPGLACGCWTFIAGALKASKRSHSSPPTSRVHSHRGQHQGLRVAEWQCDMWSESRRGCGVHRDGHWQGCPGAGATWPQGRRCRLCVRPWTQLWRGFIFWHPLCTRGHHWAGWEVCEGARGEPLG